MVVDAERVPERRRVGDRADRFRRRRFDGAKGIGGAVYGPPPEDGQDLEVATPCTALHGLLFYARRKALPDGSVQMWACDRYDAAPGRLRGLGAGRPYPGHSARPGSDAATRCGARQTLDVPAAGRPGDGQKQRALVRCVHDHNVGCGRRRGVLGGLKQVISALHGLPPRGQGGGKIWRSAAGRSAGSAPQIAAFPVAMVDMTANDRLVRERRRKPWPAGVPDSMWHPRARI